MNDCVKHFKSLDNHQAAHLPSYLPPVEQSVSSLKVPLDFDHWKNPKHGQNVIILAHDQQFLKLSLKSVHNLSGYFCTRQKDRQTDNRRLFVCYQKKQQQQYDPVFPLPFKIKLALLNEFRSTERKK